MTINSEVRAAGPFAGNGVTTSFPFEFKVFADSEVLVVREIEGVELVLELGADYTVDLNADQDSAPGGSVDLPAALPVGYALSMTSALAPLQPVDLTNQGGFYPRVINASLDRLTILVQQLSERLNRALVSPISDGGSGFADLPGADARKGAVLAFDEVTGAPLVGPSIASVGTVSANVVSINTVAAEIAAVLTAAANVADITNFADVYYGPSAADPTARRDGLPLQPGDLYFNTAENNMRNFDGAQWGNVVSGNIGTNVFSGDGVETEFSLPAAAGSKSNTQVYIGGVYQQKSTYDVAGALITFTSAPPSGSGNIEVITLAPLAFGADLGSASVADVTTSSTDTTPGRVWRTDDLVKTTSATDTTVGSVLAVGAFGAGATFAAPAPSIGNLDDIDLPSGTYYANSGVDVGTFPSGKTRGVVSYRRADTGGTKILRQVFESAPTGSLDASTFSRIYVNPNWSTWKQVWDEQSLPVTAFTKEILNDSDAQSVHITLGVAPNIRYQNGRYYPGISYDGFTVTAPAALNGKISLVPIVFTDTAIIQALSIHVVTAVAAKTVRLGIYADNAGTPGALLFDAGTASVATVGVKDIALPQLIKTGVYWLAVLSDITATATFAALPTIWGAVVSQAGSEALTPINGFTGTQAFGALPATLPWLTPNGAVAMPMVRIKV